MNQHFKPAATAPRLPAEQCPGYAARMLELYMKLDELRRAYCPMEDDTMDKITEATFAVGQSVIDAPAIDEATIATKLRYAAIMIEDPDGVMHHEHDALLAALQDLKLRRDAEWHDPNHPWYSWVPA